MAALGVTRATREPWTAPEKEMATEHTPRMILSGTTGLP